MVERWFLAFLMCCKIIFFLTEEIHKTDEEHKGTFEMGNASKQRPVAPTIKLSPNKQSEEGQQ